MTALATAASDNGFLLGRMRTNQIGNVRNFDSEGALHSGRTKRQGNNPGGRRRCRRVRGRGGEQQTTRQESALRRCRQCKEDADPKLMLQVMLRSAF